MTTTEQAARKRTTATTELPRLSDAERNAMRAYLQRCEVRLSTLHRIATAFISGAGLLLLIPVFFKDAIDSILSIMLAQNLNQFESLGSNGQLLTLVLFGCLLFPLLLSLAIPLYGVYLLLKDIIHFYFTIYAPGFAENLLNPTFALSGVLFSVDESPLGKQEVMSYQYETSQMGFMMPFSKERSELYFDPLIKSTKGSIIPETRDLKHLEQIGVLPDGYDPESVTLFNAALGIARSLDRTLPEEVAVTEMSLVRHVLYLRRLVFRYIKTLLMFIWTTAISFIMLPLLRDNRFPTFVVLGLGYLIWALAVMRLMNWPLMWVYRHRHEKLPMDQVDLQLRLMQDTVAPYTKAAIVVAAIGLGLAVAGIAY